MASNEPIKDDRRKKLLWILPLLVLPFATLLFWALGGGASAGPGKVDKGFNLKLPSAQVGNDDALDKLNHYDKAALDSSNVDELRRKDPNYRFDTVRALQDSSGANHTRSGIALSNYQSPEEKKVYQRLEALQRAVSAPPPAHLPVSAAKAAASPPEPSQGASELQAMLAAMNAPSQPDPELEQIGGMLENILDLQYPERAQQKLREEYDKNRGMVYSVATGREEDVISSLDSRNGSLLGGFQSHTVGNGFYTLESMPSPRAQDNAVQASVAATQSVVNGATVRMMLDQDIFINGLTIPKGTFIVGTASLKGERLSIAIPNIRHGNSIFPVELSVYDLDGLDGIYIPGAINRDVAKASADRSMQSLGVTTLSDSWSAQAAGAGIEAAKGLFSRKVKLVKVTLKKGYKILLRDEKQRD